MNKKIYAFTLGAIATASALAQQPAVDFKAMHQSSVAPAAVVIDGAAFGVAPAADAVAPVAGIYAPLSVLPIGLSVDYSHLVQGGNPLILGLAPYQTPLTWTNISQGDYRTSTWTYPNPADKTQMLTATTKNLNAPGYPYGQFAAPSLTVSGSALSSDPVQLYGTIQYGGIPVAPVNGQTTIFEPSLYNYKRYVDGYVTFNTYGNYLSGVGEKAEAVWKTEDYGGGDKIDKALGVGVVVPPPAVPYQVSYAYARFTAGTLTDKSKLTVNVYTATSSMKLLATGETKRSQTYQTSADSWATAVFALHPVEGDPNEPLLVDGPVFFVFGGEMAAGENIEYGMARDLDGFDEGTSCRGYFVFKDKNDQFLLLRSNLIPFPDGSSAVGVFASFDATYSWLKCDDTTFDAPASGGEKTFQVDAYYDLTDATVTKVTASAPADWIEIVPGAMDQTTGLSPLTVKVAPQPVAGAARSVTLTLNTNGLKQDFVISQGEGSVGALDASSTSARFDGDNLVVESDAATSVAVYSVSGQKVAEASFSHSAALSAGSLAQGVYVVKFNDGSVVKLAK